MWVASVVYPRWRGEHEKSGVKSIPAGGLSPLARGTQRAEKRPRFLVRFIPAGAGNTPPRKPITFMESVYPRWRGEHSRPRSTATDPIGLSPLARGTLRRQFWEERTGRFIPAGAGNTLLRARECRLNPVYPRWRGEHKSSSPESPAALGLSPLARGTLLEHRQFTDAIRFIPVQRFIPAGAGNTLFVIAVVALTPVYPRWRGEHVSAQDHQIPAGGLSPLARGTPVAGKILSVIIRFIPAGAGNTRAASTTPSA